MDAQFSKLSLKGQDSPRLMSNVYKIRINDNLVVHKYVISLERLLRTEKGTERFAVKSGGPDALRILRAKVAKAVLLFISRSDRCKDTVLIYDGYDVVYSNAEITDCGRPMDIPVESLRLVEDFDLSEDDRRIVLRQSTTVSITMKPDGGLTQIRTKIIECDREDAALINFFATLIKSAAPETQFIGFRGGRLYDTTTFQEMKGIQRGKGVKIGIKLIGQEELSVCYDIDSKDGTFFRAQPLLNSIADYSNHSEDQIRNKFDDPFFMRQVERFIRDMVVREEDTDRVFTIAGLKWREDERTGEKILQAWPQVSQDEERVRTYGKVPVVVEEYVTKEKKVGLNYFPLTALHLLKYSKVPLPKQDQLKLKKPPALKPEVRVSLIHKARSDIKIDGRTENLYLNAFRTEIAPLPVFPTYEILPAPIISAKSNGQISPLVVNPVKHDYKANKHQFVVPAQISRFQVLFDTHEISENTAKQFFEALRQVSVSKGMVAKKASFCGVGSPSELENMLALLVEERKGDTKDGVAPIVIALCLGFRDHHDYLKYVEHKFRVLCQHVMKVTVEKVLESSGFVTSETLHNIIKKVNEKCQGTNIEVTSPTECASLFPSRTGPNAAVSLIVGMDVCHGDPLTKHQERRGFLPDPSIIGISSNAVTRNPQMYTGEYIATQGRRESVPNEVMEDHGAYLIEKFRNNHGRLPDNVILVRDGVARSQYEMALGEFEALMTGVRKATSLEFKPRELLIVVTKEHGMRLFDKKYNKPCNPRPGTVVDTDIVSPFLPEFLLIPQDAFHGTAKCVLATVLKDGEKDLRKYPHESLIEMEYFIHSLCYLHGISDKSTGLPEPVSMGHDLAERGANVAKQIRRNDYSPDNKPTVDDLSRDLRTRGTLFEGIKFTA